MGKLVWASEEGLKKAAIAFNANGKSLEDMTKSTGCDHQSILEFFVGKGLYFDFFRRICDTLGLQSCEIIDLTKGVPPSIPNADLDLLIRDVRAKMYTSIQDRCGTVRVTKTTPPIALNSIYTSIDVMEDVSRNQRRKIEELLAGCESEDFDRFMLNIIPQKPQRIPILEAVKCHNRVLISGQPGVGKTTFLRWLALQCIEGMACQSRVPFFIDLAELAEVNGQIDLQSLMAQQLRQCGVKNSAEVVTQILSDGRSLLLLDNWARPTDNDPIANAICDTAQQFERNQFVVAGRPGSPKNYLQAFTELEVTDFNHQQIVDLVDRWFQPQDPAQAKTFIKELKANPGLHELATNPHVLAFLCQVFEPSGQFPVERSKLYQDAMKMLR